MPLHDYASVDRHAPLARRAATRDPYSPVMILITLLATIGILAYGFFLLNPRVRGDFIPYTMVIVAETILVAHALLAMWTILAGSKSPRDWAFHNAKRNLFDQKAIARAGVADDPTQWPVHVNGAEAVIDVFITVYGEPLETIRRTATAAREIKGRHRTWILDDGRSDDVKQLAAEIGVNYIRRLSSHGAKAGNVNHALSIAKGDFYVIFDADFVPKPEFLIETVPFFTDEHVAFVQTPQVYGNLNNIVSRGAGYMQTVFYRFVQPGRNHFNAAFCVGTNVIFRRRAIDDIGGMYTDSKSEDVWTSLMLHERGWRTIYIAKRLAVGDAPETIEAYTKQQLRWATGGFEILLTRNPFNPRRKLTLDQRLMYFVTSTHYLTGIAPLLLLFVPALEVYFDLRPVELGTSFWAWLLFYSGFYVLQVLLAFYTLGSFRFEVMLLAAVSGPIYAQAFLNAFTGKEQKWHVTGSKSKAQSPFTFMMPQVFIFAFLALTTAVSIWRDIDNYQLTLATAWSAINTFWFAAFILVAFREGRHQAQESTHTDDDDGPEEQTPITTVVVPPELEPVLVGDKVPVAASFGGAEDAVVVDRSELPAMPELPAVPELTPEPGEPAQPRRAISDHQVQGSALDVTTQPVKGVHA